MSSILYHTNVTLHQVLSQMTKNLGHPRRFESIQKALEFCYEIAGVNFATEEEFQRLYTWDRDSAVEILNQYINDGVMSVVGIDIADIPFTRPEVELLKDSVDSYVTWVKDNESQFDDADSTMSQLMDIREKLYSIK